MYPVLVHRLAHLFHASFRPRLAAVALAFSLALHLHQVGRRTFTSKLLSMPSTQPRSKRLHGTAKSVFCVDVLGHATHRPREANHRKAPVPTALHCASWEPKSSAVSLPSPSPTSAPPNRNRTPPRSMATKSTT